VLRIQLQTGYSVRTTFVTAQTGFLSGEQPVMGGPGPYGAGGMGRLALVPCAVPAFVRPSMARNSHRLPPPMVRIAVLSALVVLVSGCGASATRPPTVPETTHPAAAAPAAPEDPERASQRAGRVVARFTERWARRVGRLPGPAARGAYGNRARHITARLQREMLLAAAELRRPPTSNFRVLGRRTRRLAGVTVNMASYRLDQLHPPPATSAQHNELLLMLRSLETVLDTAFLLAAKGIPEQVPDSVAPGSHDVIAAERAFRAAAPAPVG
jgi:hypothetical protein